MADLKTFRMWLGTTGRMVCEREDCAGPEMLAGIASTKSLQNAVRDGDGEQFFMMNLNDLAEMAGLLYAEGKRLTCQHGHIYFNLDSMSLQPRKEAP